MTPLSGPILTAAEVRAAERASGVPLAELMERAGKALADAVMRFGNGAPVLVACGPGNNGGDGYVAARLLAARGCEVRVAALAEPRSDLAIFARAAWGGHVEDPRDAEPAPVLLDAVFGTGLARALDAELRVRLAHLRRSARFTIAADVPSGVGTDDGEDLGGVGADMTLAIGCAKPAHVLHPGASQCGRVIIADIRFAATSRLDVLARPKLATPGPRDHKYTRGMVAVVPGAMAGAATLGATAAARLAGYTVLCGKGDAPASVVRRGFAATLADAKLGAMLIGPGLDDTAANRTMLDAALASAVPLVLDAGALALVARERLRRDAPTIVTPHDGEFVRLFGAIEGSRIDRAREAAVRANCVVVSKGADTVVAAPDGRAGVAVGASSWLASAGTGDVLAGIVAGLLAGGRDAFEAARAGVWLQQEAARRAGPGFIADDLPRHLPAAVAACL